jgi:hypothetical protein
MTPPYLVLQGDSVEIQAGCWHPELPACRKRKGAAVQLCFSTFTNHKHLSTLGCQQLHHASCINGCMAMGSCGSCHALL